MTMPGARSVCRALGDFSDPFSRRKRADVSAGKPCARGAWSLGDILRTCPEEAAGVEKRVQQTGVFSGKPSSPQDIAFETAVGSSDLR
mmetsp:Transcript_30356/g.45165  ORF Transcript_30356/g.45165 Transcript_30356/m.45165 type:complete len:88 (+) Transcript_30356:245-508(+)